MKLESVLKETKAKVINYGEVRASLSEAVRLPLSRHVFGDVLDIVWGLESHLRSNLAAKERGVV